MKRLMAAMMVLALLACNRTVAQNTQINDLPWVLGPTTGQIAGTASIVVPEGYAFLGPEGAREFNRITENPDTGIDEYILAKDDLTWVAFFSFDPVGYVRDNETLDADDLLASVTEGTEASNEERRANGWDPIHVTGWAFKPQYDTDIKSLEWAFRLKGEQSPDESINYNTRILGRRGVMQVLLLTRPEDLTSAVADFKTRLPGFSFSPGQRYAEYRAGDHVAEYGLAALVTGGAVAVASKKGLFAALGIFLIKMWKLVLVGIVAVGMGLKKLFSSKDSEANS